MKIANPLYDYVFKFLMSNNRLAKKVLSVILNKAILSLELSQQEVVTTNKEKSLKLFRLDFKAQIKDENGRVETVLIELQKAKLQANLFRFRNYLGSTYLEKKWTDDQVEVFPIISVYILGYDIPDLPYLAVKVNNKAIDLALNQEVKLNSPFIDLLTHTCYIIQVKRLPSERNTRIEQLLSLFNQKWVGEEGYILNLEETPEEFQDIAQYLKIPLMDIQHLLQLRYEEEMEINFAYFDNRIKELEQLKLEMEKAKEELSESNAELNQVNERLNQNHLKLTQAQKELNKNHLKLTQAQKELKQNNFELEQAREAKIKLEKEISLSRTTNSALIKHLSQKGDTPDEIAKLTQLGVSEIMKILNEE